MKTLLKTIALLATFTVAGIAMGATPNDSSSFNTLYVSDVALSNNSWSSSVNLSKDELLSFELHYYLKEGVSAQDMKFSLENLNGRTYKAGESETVTGKITASNLSPAYGSVQVHFTDNVRLDLYNVSWQKYPCSSVGCEESLVDSYAKVLTSSGMSIGNVSGGNSHYTGNVIVSFKVSEYDPTPSYKNCYLDSVTVTHGNSYRFYSRETTTDTCSAYSLVRTCTDGVLSGSDSYKYASCRVDYDNDKIDITTLSATNIDKSSARLRGQMRGDDNRRVWFAFDKNNRTPSCYSSSQRIGRTTVDDGDYFSETVTRLDENKRYYFRACGEDANGDTVSGSIRNFTTDRGDDDDDDVELRAVTGIASHITTVAARLNAYVFGEGDAYCYFQFGRTSSLGLSTSGQSINLDDTSACSILRNTLSPNTTYYYRVVLKQGTNYEYGSIRNFHTNSVYVPPKPSIPEADDDGEIEVTKWVSAETDPRFDTYTRAQRGETVYYKVRVQNDTGEDLDDLTVIDRIPFYLELDTDRASDDDQAKTIQWVIDLDRGESRTFITEMRVREDARKGDVIISYASASNNKYSANSNDVEIEVEGGLYGVDSDDDANQGATIFGAGFFPQTLVGWGILLIILLIILYIISRIIVSRNEHARTLAELEAARRARNG
ncbi:MAG: hypothetical protein ACKKL4_03080 [Patescibacteria group bacterium]